MARTVRDTNLGSRAAREKLKARGKPYFRTIEPGLHLGYRRLAGGAGRWVVRHYVGGAKGYDVETIATADDLSDADGVAILNFREAQDKARSRMVSRAHAAAGKTKPITVADAMTDYLEFLDAHKKSRDFARYANRAHIEPKLGKIEAAALTSDKIRTWLADLSKAKPRARTRAGQAQQFREMPDSDDARRARRATANRILTVLKAALNRAWRDEKVPSDKAWRRVEPFENVDAARVRYLSIAEAKRLINACEPEFRKLVEAALQTGARYGELVRLTVADFNADAGTVAIRESKSGRPRHVVLTDEGAQHFKDVCAGRAGDATIFGKANGEPWGKSHQRDPMAAANATAKIVPAIGFHGLRHTWASHAVMNGVPLMVVAKNLGHSDTRMVEKHYGHLAPSYVADAIRAGAPKFGTARRGNVREMAA